MNKRFIAAVLIAASAASASAFASSGYGPAPHYDPAAGAPASQRGPSLQTIDAPASGRPAMRAFGGMPETTSQSGSHWTGRDLLSTDAHH